VTFLLDQDVPEDLTYLLRELNHEILRVRDVLPPEAADSAVLQFAYDHNCLLITCNRDDFIKLTETRSHRGIIVLIRRKTRAAERAALLQLLERQARAVSATTSILLEDDRRARTPVAHWRRCGR
jgi:predicted nuclease of predicted toxin-antitoxin system